MDRWIIVGEDEGDAVELSVVAVVVMVVVVVVVVAVVVVVPVELVWRRGRDEVMYTLSASPSSVEGEESAGAKESRPRWEDA